MSIRERVVYVPPMSDHSYAIAAAFERCDIEAQVLPESDRLSVEMGMKYVSGKECYPCTVTMGDMLKKTLSPGFDPARSAFFMPSGSGPCRFGQYNVFQRSVLESLGMPEVGLFSPNQDEGLYTALATLSADFALWAWRGVVAIELLLKCLHESRPYEAGRGAADVLYRRHLGRVAMALRGAEGRVEDALAAAVEDFRNLPRSGSRKPRIGIVGEIFVRSNRFSNEDLVRKVEALGGEAWLTPLEEWINYLNFLNLRHSLQARDYATLARTLLKGLVQKRSEHVYTRFFKAHLKTLAEISTAAALRKAAPYVHDSFEGEAVLSVGKAVDYAERGAHGVVNAMPFGCMPGTIAAALLRAVTKDHGLPVITIAYDGTESSTTEIQLEAFMDQARAKAARA